MESSASKDGSISLWSRLFSWCGILFCFCLFPGFLVMAALDSLLEAQADRQKAEVFQRLSVLLDRIEPYKHDEFYFHRVFLRMFEHAERAFDPMYSIQKSISHLKKKLPGSLKFVVWNGKGRLNAQLTDLKGFRVVLERIWRALRAVAIDQEGGGQHDPTVLSEVMGNLKMMRSVLGGFLVPSHLAFPYLPANLASVILSDFRENRSHFWYHVGDKIGFLAVISWRVLRQHIGLRRITPAMNRRIAKGFGVGYALFPRSSFIRLPPRFPWKTEIEMALGRFDNSAEPIQESEHLLIAVRPLGSGLHGFTFALKDEVIADSKLFRNRAIIWLCLFFLPVIVFTWITMVQGKGFFISIRWQLAALFLYANGLPLLVLAFIGFDYLQNKRIELFGEVQAQAEKLMSNFDTRFPSMAEHIRRDLLEILDNMESRSLHAPLSRKAIDALAHRLANLSPTEFYLCGSESKVLISNSDVVSSAIQHGTEHITITGNNFLRFFNGKITNPEKELSPDSQPGIMADSGNLLDPALSDLGKVRLMSFGTMPKWSFWEILGDSATSVFDYILFVFWESPRMQELFLKKFLPAVNENRFNLTVLARMESGQWVKPAWIRETPALLGLLRQAATSGSARQNLILENGKEFIGIGWKGREMSDASLAALYPRTLVESELGTLKFKLVLFGFFSIVLSIVIGQLVARQFLEPLGWFSMAAGNINGRNFRFRIPELEGDELGRLGCVLNDTLGSLEELDLGRVVQASLLPASHFRQGRFTVFGKSQAMTDLGGDYFDIFPLGDSRFGVVLGDVAGHGVPAALMMAFAKAGVLIGRDRSGSPAQLLALLHDLFLRNKRKTMQRVMTMQYLIIDSESGAATFSNAGHCYPIHLSCAKEIASFIELQGFPLGSIKRATFRNKDLQMAPGDILVMYSDGFVEARDSAGRAFGFPRWLRTVGECRDKDPQAVYEKVRAANDAFTEEPGDDLTMVVIRADGEDVKVGFGV